MSIGSVRAAQASTTTAPLTAASTTKPVDPLDEVVATEDRYVSRTENAFKIGGLMLFPAAMMSGLLLMMHGVPAKNKMIAAGAMLGIFGGGGAVMGAITGGHMVTHDVTRREQQQREANALLEARRKDDASATGPARIVRNSANPVWSRAFQVDDLAKAYVQTYDANGNGEVELTAEGTRTSGNNVQWDSSRLFRRADAQGDRSGAASEQEVRETIGSIDQPQTFQSTVGYPDGQLDGKELANFRAAFAEQEPGRDRMDDTRRVVAMTESIGPMASLFMQRYDSNFDGRISLASETRAGNHDLTRLLRESDIDDDRQVGMGELGNRLRQFDARHLVGLGDDDPGPDGKIRTRGEEGNNLLLELG